MPPRVDNGLPPRPRGRGRAPRHHPTTTPTGIDVPAWGGRRAQEALAQVKAQGRRRGTPCVICHQPINYSLTYPDDQSCSVQHVKTRVAHPELTWDPRNWQPAHLDCNRHLGPRAAPADLGQPTI